MYLNSHCALFDRDVLQTKFSREIELFSFSGRAILCRVAQQNLLPVF